MGSAAKLRVPALPPGDELAIAGDGFMGATLFDNGGLYHLAAFSDGEQAHVTGTPVIATCGTPSRDIGTSHRG
jgi:hypothetical protein